MSDFNPGEGWREATEEEAAAPMAIGAVSYHGPDGWHYWVREEPVPPLPTEPGYYVTSDGAPYGGAVYRLDADDDGLPLWDDTFGNPQDEYDLRQSMPLTRLEPRAVTAKAAVDFLRENTVAAPGTIAQLARHFGVDQ